MAAVRERRVPKRYSDEVFPTGLLFRKKTRTKTNDRKLYPVVVTAVNKITKRVKFTKLAGIFGIFLVILAGSLCVVKLFLKLLSLGISFFKDSSSARFSPQIFIFLFNKVIIKLLIK